MAEDSKPRSPEAPHGTDLRHRSWQLKATRTYLYEQVADRLERMIRTGELQSGDQLPSEHRLCELFHVSRPVIREACKELAVRGLLVIEPGRGSFVADRTATVALAALVRHCQMQQVLLADLQEACALLKPSLAAWVTQHLGESDRRRLGTIQGQLLAAVDDPDAWQGAFRDLERFLTAACANPLLWTPIIAAATLLQEWLHASPAGGAGRTGHASHFGRSAQCVERC